MWMHIAAVSLSTKHVLYLVIVVITVINNYIKSNSNACKPVNEYIPFIPYLTSTAKIKQE